MKLNVQQWINSGSNPPLLKPYPPDGDICFGFVRFDSENKIFRICIGAVHGSTYDIASDRIMSGGGFLDFILQVHSKDWVTAQHLKDVIDCVTCWIYRDHGKLPQAFFDVAGGVNRDLDDPNKI